MKRQLLLAIATLATLGAACGPEPAADEKRGTGLDALFDREELVIINNNGEQHEFEVYIAASNEQRQRGLMFVRSLPEKSGMLFVFDRASMQSMWMKNTFIPLDMIFAHADGTVSSVIHDTKPKSLESQSSTEPVTYVLELNAGTARRYNIGRRSRLVRPTD